MAEAGFQRASPCQFCENPAQYQCQNCDDPLCTTCKSSHEREKPHHKYVPYSQRARILCTIHKDMKYIFWCEACEKACCTKCVIESHNGHIIAIEDAIRSKRDSLREQVNGPLKESFEEWHTFCQDARLMTNEYIAQIQNLDDQLVSHAARIHEAVDENLEKIRRAIQKISESTEAILKKQEEEGNDEFEKIKRNFSKAEDYVDCTDISILLECTFEPVVKATSVPPLTRQSPPSYISGEISDQTIMTIIGQISSINQKFEKDDVSNNARATVREKHSPQPFGTTTVLSKPVTLSSFNTGYNEPHIICTTSEGLAWVKTGDRRLQLLDCQGAVKDTILTDFEFYGITITPNGDVLFTDSSNRRIVSASKRATSWETKTLFSTERKPWRISCTRAGGIVVTYPFFPDHRVIQYDNEGTIVHEYDPNLFSSPNTVAVNKSNDNVYIRDGNKHKIFVFGKDHSFLYEYTGSHNESFHPGGVTTDITGRVLMTDMKNNKIHVLNKDGKFIQYLQPSGLEKPCYVDVNNEGNVWIGGYKGNIEILKYC